MGFPSSPVENTPSNAGDLGLTPVLVRAPGKGKDNPLQYSCLENPIDRGAWQATVHGVAGSNMTEHTSATLLLGIYRKEII